MNKIHKLFLILTIGILFTSCNKEDAPSVTPPREYDVQYAADIVAIDKYIDEHYMTVDAEYNVTFTKIPVGGTQESIRVQDEYPLQSKIVENEDHDVDYKVYYLSLREGVNEKPTAVDSIYVSYKGNLLDDSQFDYAPNPVWFQLESVVPGWAEIIPLFKTGNFDTSTGPNPSTFTDFGAGVMFLPSGMAYFNGIPSASIPQYSPLIFSFKLNNQRFRDHDRDGIWSKYEVLTPGDNPKDYDSDGDTFANMYDMDDDGDHYLTKNETRKPVGAPNTGLGLYYPFDPVADNPATPEDETELYGIPRRFTGPLGSNNLPTPVPEDYTAQNRLRRHLDPTCFPPYE